MTVTLLTSQSAPTTTEADALVIGVFQGQDGPVLTLNTDEIDLTAALTVAGIKASNSFPGPHVDVTVRNGGSAAQSQIAVYAVAIAGGRVVGAGRGIVASLAWAGFIVGTRFRIGDGYATGFS